MGRDSKQGHKRGKESDTGSSSPKRRKPASAKRTKTLRRATTIRRSLLNINCGNPYHRDNILTQGLQAADLAFQISRHASYCDAAVKGQETSR